MQSGIFGLGSAALLGGGGVSGLYDLGKSLGGLFSNSGAGAGGSAIDYSNQLGDPGNFFGV
jgi:hypothetical protein